MQVVARSLAHITVVMCATSAHQLSIPHTSVQFPRISALILGSTGSLLSQRQLLPLVLVQSRHLLRKGRAVGRGFEMNQVASQ